MDKKTTTTVSSDVLMFEYHAWWVILTLLYPPSQIHLNIKRSSSLGGNGAGYGAEQLAADLLCLHDGRGHLRRGGRAQHLDAGGVHLVLLRHGGEDVVDVRLQHHAGHDDLVQDVAHAVRVEDKVQLAHVLEALVQRLHEDLDQVQDAQVRLLLVHREDEVQGGVVSVYDARGVAPLGDAAFQVVTEGVWPLRHLLEDLADHALLLVLARLQVYMYV